MDDSEQLMGNTALRIDGNNAGIVPGGETIGAKHARPLHEMAEFHMAVLHSRQGFGVRPLA